MRPRRLAALLSLLACNAPTPGATDGAGTTTSTTADATSTTGPADVTTTPGTTTSPTTSTGSTTAPTTSEGCNFLDCSDTDTTHGGNCPLECDVWDLDSCCTPNQKCVPWANDGSSSWNAVKCVEIARDPVPVGGACKVEGSGTSGLDDCELGAICWNVDDDTHEGTCVAQCHGSQEAPDCSHVPGTACAIANDGVLTLCLPQCDPLAQDCPAGLLCLPAPMHDGAFVCILDASGDDGQTFDPCSFANGCDPGLLCAAPEGAAECDPDADGCCLPFCDLTAPPSCPGVGQQCAPWFDMVAPPPGLENLGVCVLP